MKRFTGWTLILTLGLLAACASSRNEAGGRDKHPASTLTDEERLEFEKYFFNANRDKILGNKKEAIENLQRCLLIDPKSSASYFLLGQLYADMTKYRQAVEHTEKAVSLEPGNEWYLEQLASDYTQVKEYVKSAQVYHKLRVLFPGNRNYYLSEGLQWFYAGKATESVSAYDELEKLEGVTEEVSRIKQEIYLASGKSDKAINELKKLNKTYPDNPEYLRLLADLYMELKKPEEARSVYQQILLLQPANGNAHLGMAEYYRIKGETGKSFEELKLAFSDPATDIKTKINVMMTYREQLKDPVKKQEAMELAALMIEAHPTEAGSYAVSSDLYFETGDLETSHKHLKKALELERADFAAWNKLLLIDESLKNFSYMKEDSEKAMEYFPDQTSLYVFGSFANYMLKDYRKMADLSLQGLDLSLFNDLKMQFMTNLGDAYNYLKMYDSSDYYYNQALELDSNNALVLNNYAYFLSVRNTQLEKAERLSRKANDVTPDNASYLDTYGWILYKMGKVKEAEDFIRRSLEINPSSAEVLEHYGDVHYKLGNREKAVDYWKKAKDKGSSGPLLERKIKDQKLYE